ncbi:MAG: hypothetical protein KKF54_07360 [Candidatus Omnitrophica bacterium]|nr:hypothetical protein [Candidatus Omnitrophota bacterium]
MSINLTIDKNIINNLTTELLKKILPALKQKKIIMHLTDPFFQELLSDGNKNRKARHADIYNKIFNGSIILSLPELIKSELKGTRKLFYGQHIEVKIRALLVDLAQGKSLDDLLDRKLNEMAKYRRLFNADLKFRQERNLVNVFNNIKDDIVNKPNDRKKIKNISFSDYYSIFSRDIKIKKIQKFLEAENIPYANCIDDYLNNPKFPCINAWVRYWFAYHYYTVQRGQPTLKGNDASDLVYIVAGNCVDYFVTNDDMLLTMGTLCYYSGKFINWSTFESKFL